MIHLMELKVFTLPTCLTCPTAKVIASEVAQELGITYREVDMATEEGLKEALAQDVSGTPSIAMDSEVIVRRRLISKEKLEEVTRRIIEQRG